MDWAEEIKDLVDVHHPQAERVILVMDNLNTHPPASLYEALEPPEARRSIKRLEMVYTPKYGSRLADAVHARLAGRAADPIVTKSPPVHAARQRIAAVRRARV